MGILNKVPDTQTRQPRHAATLRISSATNMEHQMNPPEDSCTTVQKGFSFLRENIMREERLLGKLYSLCNQPLTDEEKLRLMRDGGLSKMRILLKVLIQTGNDPCTEFLKELKDSSLCMEFLQCLQHKTITEEAKMFDVEKLDSLEILLIEEIQPTLFSDALLSSFLLNVNDHNLMEGKTNRKEKVEFLISKIRQNPAKLPVFYQALLDSEYCQVIQEAHCRSARQLPGDSETCVRLNFRNLVKEFECCTKKKILFDHLERRTFIDWNPLPKQCHLIKAGLRHKKCGCDCLLKFIQDMDLDFLEKIIERFEEREQNGRRKVNFSIDIPVLESLKEFLLDELEPTPVSNVLLEEKVFSVDDHDAVNNLGKRKEKAKALIKLLKSNSPEMLDEFLFALYECESFFIVNELKKFRNGSSPEVAEHESTPTAEEDNQAEEHTINIRLVGEIQSFEVLSMVSDLEVILSIPTMEEDESVDRAVDIANNNVNLKTEIVETCGMNIIEAKKGSVVLRLVPLTDDACRKLLDEKGKKVQEMLTILLQNSDLTEDMIGGMIEIKVLVSVKKDDEREKTNFAKVKFEEHMNLLQEELEPSILVTKWQREKIFTETHSKTVMDGKSRKRKVENLLNILLEVKGEAAYGTLITSLEDTGKEDIAAKLRTPPANHEEAEDVRKGLLCRFSDVIEEMESSIIDETFHLCGIQKDSMKKIEGKRRKDRALNFLMTVMSNDVYVLALKEVLKSRNLQKLFEKQEEMQEELHVEPMEQCSTGKKRKIADGEIIFKCQYEVVKKNEEKMDVDSSSDNESMDVEFSSKTKQFPWKHEPPPIMKISQQKKPPQPPKVEAPSQSSKPPQQEKSAKSKTKSEVKKTDSKRIYGRPQPEEKCEVVVALDFGTTYSGFALLKKGEIIPGKWKEEALESLKTPTALLLQNGKEPKFGFEAEKTFKELTEDGKDRDCRFFNKFKMCLHNKSSFDTDFKIMDHLERPYRALEVFSLSIQYLKKECDNSLEENSIKVSDDEIQWILTVPAIWDESAKQFMREAAEQAGIQSDQLKLALEPEAAAIYVIKEAKTVLGRESLQTFAPGTKIMLADLGGGTADFTVMELLEDGKMKQFYRAFGGDWGGNRINIQIWKKMEEIFGRDTMTEFKKVTADYMEMEHEIELRKRSLSTGSKLQLTIFPNFAELCRKCTGKDYKRLIKEYRFPDDINVRTGKLVFEPKAVEDIFEKTLSSLFGTVKQVLESPNIRDIKDIILVGGFSQSDIIVNQFKQRFQNYNVIIPIDPELAVLKGAVMFGQDSEIITSRISPHTYGFYSMRAFMRGDPENKRLTIDKVDFCEDVFEKLVTIGDSVGVGKMVQKEVFASSAVMKKMFIKFYQTNEKDPKFVTDKGCRCIGELIVGMPDISKGTERSVVVDVYFGETEITVHGMDKTTRQMQKTKLNLLVKTESKKKMSF